MEETLVSTVREHVGQPVRLSGWVYNFRSSGSISFVQFRDGTGRIQVVYAKDEIPAETWDTIQELSVESAVYVTGTVKEESRAPSGFEILGQKLEVISTSESYPISKKEHGPDFLLNHRHLWMRTARQEAILRIRNEIAFAMRLFFHDRGFVNADSPIFTPNAVEGTTDLFEVNYFDDTAYLSQSGQLYQEATSAALRKTYCFGPTFRSEKSKTRRHLTEFWMLEAEVSFMDWEENMRLQEDMMVFVLKCVLERSAVDLKTLKRDLTILEKIAEGNFSRIHYRDAVTELQKLGSDIKMGEDFGGDDETLFTKQHDRPVFIHHFPAAIKAFYMEPDPAEPEFALCNDLLAPEGYGEIIGGSQRIADLALLEKRISEHNLPRGAFEWYLDLRRYGSVPHAGFGIGLERTVAWICGLEHVRETIPFPRLLNRLTP